MASLLDLSVRLKPSSPAITGQSARVLVADDDPLIRELEAALIRRVGHHVDIVPDAETAWQMLLAANYDLLVTDYQMPGMSGLELVRQIRAAHMSLPIIMVSGSLELLNTATLIAAPLRIHAFVRKPFTNSQLLGAVNSALPPDAAGALTPRIALG